MTSIDEFTPTRVVVMSELSAREKEKYYSILVSQDAKFHFDRKGRIISNVRLLHAKARRIIEESKVDHVKKEIGFEDRLKRLNELPANGITIIVRGVPDFDYNLYTTFVALASDPGEIVYPRRHVLTWVMRLVEDCYDSRFTFEKLHVQKDPTLSDSGKLESFPIFVMKHLCTLVGLKRIVDQNAWDLLWNGHMYRSDYLDVEIFMRFMQQIYDNDDLLFFLYARSLVAKQLNINYKRRWVSSESAGKGPKTTWMSFKEVSFISRTIFGTGDDNRQILSEFMNLVTRHIVGKKAENSDSRRIDIIQFLHLAVVTYHQMNVDGAWGSGKASRGGGGQGTVEAMNKMNLSSTADEPIQQENTIAMDNRELDLEDARYPFDSVSKRAYVPLNPNPPVPTSVASKLDGPPKKKDPVPMINTTSTASIKTANDNNDVVITSSTNKDGYTLDQLESLDDFDEFLRQDTNNQQQSNQYLSSSPPRPANDVVSAIKAAEMEYKYKEKSDKMNANNTSVNNNDTSSPSKSSMLNPNKPTVLSTEERMMLANQFSSGSLGAALYGTDKSNNEISNDDQEQVRDFQDASVHPDETFDGIDRDGEYRDAWIVAAEMCGVPLDEADDFEQCFMEKAQDVLGALLEDIDGLNDEQQSHIVDVLYDSISVEVNQEFTKFTEIASLEDFDEGLRSIITTDEFMEFIASARDKVLSEIMD